MLPIREPPGRVTTTTLVGAHRRGIGRESTKSVGRSAAIRAAGAGQNCAQSANVVSCARTRVEARRQTSRSARLGAARSTRPTHRGQHHAHPVRAGRRGLRAGRAGAARRRTGEHPAAHPARPPVLAGRRTLAAARAVDAVARDRPAPGPAGRAARAGAQRLHARRPDPVGGAGDQGRAAAVGIDDRILLAAAKTVWSNLDVQNAVLIDSYRRESARLQRQDLQRQQSVLDALLEGRGADPEFADDARAALDIGADDAVACVVRAVRRLAGRRRSRRPRTGSTGSASRPGGTSGPAPTSGCCRARCPDEPGWWSCSSRTRPAGWAWRRRADGIAGFAAAFQLATRAAETLPRGERRVVAVGDRLPEVLLAGSPQVTPLLVARPSGRCWPAGAPAPHAARDPRRAAAPRRLAHPRRRGPVLPPQHRDLPAQADRAPHRPLLTDPRDKMLLALALMVRGS